MLSFWHILTLTIKICINIVIVKIKYVRTMLLLYIFIYERFGFFFNQVVVQLIGLVENFGAFLNYLNHRNISFTFLYICLRCQNVDVIIWINYMFTVYAFKHFVVGPLCSLLQTIPIIHALIYRLCVELVGWRMQSITANNKTNETFENFDFLFLWDTVKWKNRKIN